MMISKTMNSVSGEHVYVESGLHVDISGQPVDISGVYLASGQFVLISGQHVYVESGVHVIADVAVEVSSGLFIDGVSGVHVYVESGVYVIADVNVEVSSGLWVDGVSGVHVYQESGAFVTTQPNIGISGTVTVESGLGVLISGQHIYLESGAYVVADITESGIGVQIQSGAYPASGVGVTIQSGAGVLISGQHVYQESGAFVTARLSAPVLINQLYSGVVEVVSGLHIWISGQHVYQESGAFVTARLSAPVLINQLYSGVVEVVSGLHVWISGQHIYQESGTFVTAEIIGGGTRMAVDDTVQAAVHITTPHYEIHKGNMWHAWCINSGLGDNANLDMLIVTGSGKEIHMAPDGACGGDSWFEMYEGVTVSDNGALIIPICMHRTISGTAATLAYCEPTVTSTMYPLSKQFMTGGEKKEAIGGIIRPNTEWILDGVSGSVNYLVRVKNVAGAAKDASVGIEFYEENF